MALIDRLAKWKPLGVEFVSITVELTRFRQLLEIEAEKPIHEIDCNAAVLLSDLCQFLKLGVAQHDAILGQQAVEYLTDFMETRISAPIRH